MKIEEVIQNWNTANEIDEFTKFKLAEMLDSAVQYIEQQNAVQQSMHPTSETLRGKLALLKPEQLSALEVLLTPLTRG